VNEREKGGKRREVTFRFRAPAWGKRKKKWRKEEVRVLFVLAHLEERKKKGPRKKEKGGKVAYTSTLASGEKEKRKGGGESPLLLCQGAKERSKREKRKKEGGRFYRGKEKAWTRKRGETGRREKE